MNLYYIIIYFIASLIMGLLGMNRKMGFWGYFFGSILLTPVIGLLLVLVSDRRAPMVTFEQYQKMQEKLQKQKEREAQKQQKATREPEGAEASEAGESAGSAEPGSADTPLHQKA